MRLFITLLVVDLLQQAAYGIQCQYGAMAEYTLTTVRSVSYANCKKACCLVNSELKYTSEWPTAPLKSSTEFNCGFNEVFFQYKQSAISPDIPYFGGQVGIDGTFCCCSGRDNCNVDLMTCKNSGGKPVSSPPAELVPEPTPDLKCRIGMSNLLETRDHSCDGICCVTKISQEGAGPSSIFSCNSINATALEYAAKGTDGLCCCDSTYDICNSDLDECARTKGSIRYSLSTGSKIVSAIPTVVAFFVFLMVYSE